MLNFWTGTVKLSPSSDTWVNTVRMEPNVFQVEGNFTETIATAEKKFGGFDPQTGLTRTIWGGWQTLWTGVKTNTRVRRRKESNKDYSELDLILVHMLQLLKQQEQQLIKIDLLIAKR